METETVTEESDIVSPAKNTMIFNGGVVVRPGGIYCSLETTKKNKFAIFKYPSPVRPILTSMRIKYHSLKSACVVRSFSLVKGVLLASGIPQIIFSAIKTIPVYVVNLTCWEPHNKSMKFNMSSRFPASTASGNTSFRVKIAFVFMRMPLEAANNVRIFIVDECCFVLRKFYLDHIEDFTKKMQGGVHGYGN